MASISLARICKAYRAYLFDRRKRGKSNSNRSNAGRTRGRNARSTEIAKQAYNNALVANQYALKAAAIVSINAMMAADFEIAPPRKIRVTITLEA